MAGCGLLCCAYHGSHPMGLLKNFISHHLRPRDGNSQTAAQPAAYSVACLRAATDQRYFKDFRRDPDYTLVLEHVTESYGQAYLDLISKDSQVMNAMDAFKPNDLYGNPRMYEYPAAGTISPTTLRYIKVLVDLKAHFKTLDHLKLCEIGVGYGGQCRILNSYYKPASYCLVDIKPALALAQRYLENFAIETHLTYKTMSELDNSDYDMVISNYAFTELVRPIQDAYLSKVILKSKMGYMTYNEITPIEFNSYKADELLEMIPGAIKINEEPLTHCDNCIILWGVNA
jgi:putative sugar O-methyltransferase